MAKEFLSPQAASQAALDRVTVPAPGNEIDFLEFEPYLDRIMVEIQPRKQSGLIVAPEIAFQDREGRRGKVLKVGKGIRITARGEERQCSQVKPGDTVLIGLHSDVESSDGRYVICQEQDVRLILERCDG